MGGAPGFPPLEPPPPPPPPPPPQPQQQAYPATPAAQPGPDGRRTLAGFVVSFQDDPLGKFWPIWQGQNMVGRADTGQKMDIPVGHGTTSTRHAMIECDGQRLALVDMGSTNGTFLNEEAIGYQGRRDVRDGDRIRFGGYTVLVIHVAGRF